MFWNSKGHWKKPTKAGKSNEKPRQRTDEIMQRPVKPSKGIGKKRKIIANKPAPAPKPMVVDPKPISEPITEPIVEEIEKVEEPVVEEIVEEPVEEKQDLVIDMNLSRKQLTAIAKEKGISVSKRMAKQDIVDAILSK